MAMCACQCNVKELNKHVCAVRKKAKSGLTKTFSITHEESKLKFEIFKHSFSHKIITIAMLLAHTLMEWSASDIDDAVRWRWLAFRTEHECTALRDEIFKWESEERDLCTYMQNSVIIITHISQSCTIIMLYSDPERNQERIIF